MVVAEHLAEIELADLYAQTGIDLRSCPPVMTAAQLGPVIGLSEGALATDRYRARINDDELDQAPEINRGGVARIDRRAGRGDGIPYVKIGRRVRYLRVDVARFLLANRYSRA